MTMAPSTNAAPPKVAGPRWDIILVDTQAATDKGEWLREKLSEYPTSHIIGYAGDLDQFCALEDAMRRSLANPSRWGLRCAHLGIGAAEKIGKADAIEPPTFLPQGFAGVRVRNLQHMTEIANAFRDKGPMTVIVWIADRDNQQVNLEITALDGTMGARDPIDMTGPTLPAPPPTETELPEEPTVH